MLIGSVALYLLLATFARDGMSGIIADPFGASFIAEWTTTGDTVIPAQLAGLAFSILGMVLGSLVPRAGAEPATHTHVKH